MVNDMHLQPELLASCNLQRGYIYVDLSPNSVVGDNILDTVRLRGKVGTVRRNIVLKVVVVFDAAREGGCFSLAYVKMSMC